jgi:alkylation response protein AidB-like acyl-CoA dehydrogenase
VRHERDGETGYLLTGEYPYASGNAVADVATLGMLVEGPNGEPTVAMGIVSRDQWTIKDTWYTLGMRGTGSNTLVVENVFVPDYAILSFAALADGDYATPYAATEPISRAAFLPVGTVIHATSSIGAARAALEYSLEKLPGRPVAYTIYPESRNSPTHHIAIAEAASKIDAAHLLIARACDDIDAYAARGEYPDALARARMRMDTSHAVELCREAIDTLMTANGAGAFAESSVLGRIWRDANTGGRHSFATTEIAKEVYGRVLMGADDALSIPV